METLNLYVACIDTVLGKALMPQCLTADRRPQTADYRLQTAYSRPQTVDYKRLEDCWSQILKTTELTLTQILVVLKL